MGPERVCTGTEACYDYDSGSTYFFSGLLTGHRSNLASRVGSGQGDLARPVRPDLARPVR